MPKTQILAEVVTIGDEILFGQITDTNTQYISAELSLIGIKTIRKSSVGDTKDAILEILNEASQRADIVLITGGLGPTKDDITKTTLATFFGKEMVRHEETLKMVTEYFTKRGREMLEINKQQADVPANCKVLLNTMGTAPGMWFEHKGKVFISMPGVPYEMKHLMTTHVVPLLKAHFQTPVIIHKMVHTVGIGESFLAQMIEKWENNLPEYIKLAYLPSLGIVKLRLTANGENTSVLQNEIESQTKELISLIQPYIFGFDENSKLEAVLGKKLISTQLSIATAESCTGGYLAHLLTSIPGSSAYYKGSIIAYENEIKKSNLGVNTKTLEQYGAVSEQTALEMAKGVSEKLGTSIGISTSGIAGPDGGTPEKPVGTVWIAYADSQKVVAKKFTFGNSRANNIELAAINALNFLRQNLD
jgi:nicotinamide-nucleotide amidase